MPRPKRRCGGGRVTPKGTRPGDRLRAAASPEPQLEQVLLMDAADAAVLTDLDEAEYWASSMQALFRPLVYACDPAMTAPRVLAAAEVCDDRAAAGAVAAAMGVYGPPGCRAQAHDLLEQLAGDGEPPPGWAAALGDVVPRRSVLLTDPWGDERAVWIDFQRPDGAVRGMGVAVHATAGMGANGLAYGPAVETVAAEFERWPDAAVEEISLGDARVMVEAALEVRDVAAALRHGDGGDGGDDEMMDEKLRALLDHRIGLLPACGEQHGPRWLTDEEIDDLRGEFRAAVDERDASDADTVLAAACRFSEAWWDGDVLCWSPRRVVEFVSVWIPAKSVCDEWWHDAVESVFPQWLRFAAQQRGLAQDRLRENLEAARGAFGDMRANAADPAKRSVTTNIVTDMIADGVDFDDDADVQEWMENYNARPRSERY